MVKLLCIILVVNNSYCHNVVIYYVGNLSFRVIVMTQTVIFRKDISAKNLVHCPIEAGQMTMEQQHHNGVVDTRAGLVRQNVITRNHIFSISQKYLNKW